MHERRHHEAGGDGGVVGDVPVAVYDVPVRTVPPTAVPRETLAAAVPAGAAGALAGQPAGDAAGGATGGAAGERHAGCPVHDEPAAVPAVVVTLSLPGMRPETLRVRCVERSLTVTALGRTTLTGIDVRFGARPDDISADRASERVASEGVASEWVASEGVAACYEHAIELDRRIDAAAVQAELAGVDGVRLVLPLQTVPMPAGEPAG